MRPARPMPGLKRPKQKTPMRKVPKGNVSDKFYTQFQGAKKKR